MSSTAESKNSIDLTADQLNTLRTTLGQGDEEIRESYNELKKKYPKGYITREEFLKYVQNAPRANNARSPMDNFLKMFFDYIDDDHSGEIDFYEHMLACEVIFKDDDNVRTKTLFKLFDLNRNGRVSKDEIIKVLHLMTMASMSMATDAEKQKVEEAELEKVKGAINEVFGDKTELTQEEFRDIISHNEVLEEAFGAVLQMIGYGLLGVWMPDDA